MQLQRLAGMQQELNMRWSAASVPVALASAGAAVRPPLSCTSGGSKAGIEIARL